MPDELMTAHILERFHCSPQDYARYEDYFQLWYLLLNQEAYAQKMRDEGMGAVDRAWYDEYVDYIPDGLEVDKIKELKAAGE